MMIAKKASPDDVYVGERIKAVRLSRGMSQTALAEHAGITFQQIQKYEKGNNRISIGRLIRFADLLDVTVSDLLPPQTKRKASAGVDDPIHALSLSSRGLRMAKAFNGIDDEDVRHGLVTLAESISTASQKKKPRRAAGA